MSGNGQLDAGQARAAAGAASGNPGAGAVPAPAKLARLIEDAGWQHYVIQKRADFDRASALAHAGLVSSMVSKPEKSGWRLHLTRIGETVRRELMARERARG